MVGIRNLRLCMAWLVVAMKPQPFPQCDMHHVKPKGKKSENQKPGSREVFNQKEREENGFCGGKAKKRTRRTRRRKDKKKKL